MSSVNTEQILMLASYVICRIRHHIPRRSFSSVGAFPLPHNEGILGV